MSLSTFAQVGAGWASERGVPRRGWQLSSTLCSAPAGLGYWGADSPIRSLCSIIGRRGKIGQHLCVVAGFRIPLLTQTKSILGLVAALYLYSKLQLTQYTAMTGKSGSTFVSWPAFGCRCRCGDVSTQSVCRWRYRCWHRFGVTLQTSITEVHIHRRQLEHQLGSPLPW